ncbi:hypothetical protein ABH935_007011 [Catenulispora sp. GAS73]|uniref:hypothetical protein n=1 Tax=Catenulispora sp. GAS73 TaxID=3156269 RepID=UPI003518F16E
MDSQTVAPGKDPMFDPDVKLLVEMLLDDKSLACISVPAALSGETAALLRAVGVHQIAAGKVADRLERSVLSGLCLINEHQCDAVELLLGEIAGTALPAAVRADQMATLFKTRRRTAP